MNEALELLNRILCDPLPKLAPQCAYLYCQTRSNQQSVFQAARDLVNNSLISNILILKTKTKNGYPGYAEWRDQLQKHGLSMDQVLGVEIEESEALNTLIETEALVRFIKEKKFESLVVVASPFQQLRAFMTAVTVSLREYPELLIFSYPGAALSWQEEVIHSQGTLKAIRRDLISDEFERIHKYQEKGDLAKFDQVLNYLNYRSAEA